MCVCERECVYRENESERLREREEERESVCVCVREKWKAHSLKISGVA